MKKKNLLVSAIAMLVVSALGLTAATYAWFTAAREPSIASFNMGVTTTQNLKISELGKASTFDYLGTTANDTTDWMDALDNVRLKGVDQADDGANWKDIVKLADSTPGAVQPDGTSVYAAPAALAAGTGSLAQTKYATMSFAKAEAYDADTATRFINSESYIRYTIYFRAEDVQGVYLNLGLITGGVNGTTRSRFTDTLRSGYADGDPSIDQAIRVGVAVHSAADAGIASFKVLAPNGASYLTQGGAPGYIADETVVNSANITAAAALVDANAWDSATGSLVKYTDADNNNWLLWKLFNLTESPDATAANITDNSANNGIIGVTFFIWVEGHDDDCVNDNSGTTITSTMSFYGIVDAAN